MKVTMINGKVVEANVLITLLRFTKVVNGKRLPLAQTIQRLKRNVKSMPLKVTITESNN